MPLYSSETMVAIQQRMLDSVINEIDKSEGSFIYDSLSPAALELAQLYTELDRILAIVFAETSYGEYLEKRAAEFGVTREPGTKATGVVRFTGNDGTIIPQGTQVQTDGGLIYTTISQVTITSGYADVNVEAADTGPLYKIPAGSITQIPVQIVGVIGVTNQNSFTSGGTDIETDEDLLKRLLIKAQTPSTSGNANDYKLWSLNVSGVGDAKVFPLWNGNSTVKVVIINSDKKPADSTLISSVSAEIENKRPIGATVTVVSAQGLSINVSFSVIKEASYSIEQVKSNIEASITEYLKTVAFKSNYVSYAQIGNAIINSEGVTDYSNLTLNGGVANISVSTEQVAVLGTVIIE